MTAGIQRAIKNITWLGLIFTPVIMGFRLDPFMPLLLSHRTAKEFVALAFAMAIGLLGVYCGGIKPMKNKWLLAFVGFFIINVFAAPPVIIAYNEQNIGSFWLYKPLFYAMVYFFMFIVLSSFNFCTRETDKMFNGIVWTAFIVSLYVISQSLHFDQFNWTAPANKIGTPDVPHITGTLDQPTLLAAYLAMTIPFFLYQKAWWRLGSLLLAIILTKSDMAIGTAALVFPFYFFHAVKWTRLPIIVLTVLVVVIMGLNFNKMASLFNKHSSGRVSTWQNLIQDLRESPFGPKDKRTYPMFGRGAGAFEQLFHQKHELKKAIHTRMHQAHNEYLEGVYSYGFVGFGLFILSIWWLLSNFYQLNMEGRWLAVLTSFLAVCLLALGTFPWQIEPHRFYTVVMAGLMHGHVRQKNQKEDSNENT